VLDDAAAILCVDREDAARMAGLYPAKRILHLPTGVDPQRFVGGDRARFRTRFGLAEDTRILLTVSRIDHQKNQWLAVDILARLLGEDKPVHLVLVGPVSNPAYHNRLLKAIETQGLKNHVTIIPGLPAGDPLLADAYRAADLFLLTSLHEPFGIVVLEAWAAGCPVVTTAVGGIPHFTADGEDVLRFASGDAAAGASLAWRVLANPGLAEKLGNNGRTKACETYSWDRVTGQLADLYQEVLAEHKGNHA
jgi:glycosyltransferase involved in cell wall biosynthesis